MERTIARSELTTRRAALEYGFATEADDAGLRALLRETPMGGAIRLTFEREPRFFDSVRREGIRHYTICARDAGRIVAMASRTVWPTGVGYLHQLRIAPSHRHLTRQFLRIGFRMLRETHAPDEASFDVTTIVSDNHVARRVLEVGLPGLPRYTPVERILTMLLPARAGFGACDLRAFKQVVVRGYSPAIARWRWLLRLPPVGTVLPIAYVNGDCQEAPRDCRWLVLGLPAAHPLVPVVKRRYRPRVCESTLYLVHEPGTPPDVGDLRWEVAWL
jgi:hypothetical protein